MLAGNYNLSCHLDIRRDLECAQFTLQNWLYMRLPWPHLQMCDSCYCGPHSGWRMAQKEIQLLGSHEAYRVKLILAQVAGVEACQVQVTEAW